MSSRSFKYKRLPLFPPPKNPETSKFGDFSVFSCPEVKALPRRRRKSLLKFYLSNLDVRRLPGKTKKKLRPKNNGWKPFPEPSVLLKLRFLDYEALAPVGVRHRQRKKDGLPSIILFSWCYVSGWRNFGYDCKEHRSLNIANRPIKIDF